MASSGTAHLEGVNIIAPTGKKEGPREAALPVRCLDQHPEWDLQIRLGASAAIRSSLTKTVNSLDIGSPPFDC